MRNDIILQKMLRYTMKLVEYCSGYTYDTFISDIKLVEACVFNLSQLGELYGLRNRIVHDYEGVNLQLVWEIISEDIPELRDELEKLV